MGGEDVADIGARREWMRLRKNAHAGDKHERAYGEKHSRRDSASVTFAAIGWRIVLALKPAGSEQCEGRNCRERIVFLPARKAEEADDHRDPDTQK